MLAGRTLKPIADMVDEQNRFISDSSHELRTPLTSLKSAMEVSMRDKKLNIKDAKTLISESIEEVNKLQSLSDSLLQLAQYQKPKTTIEFTKISLNEVVTSAMHKIEPLAKNKSITIQLNSPQITIKGNAYGLIDLCVIILDNAIKYSPNDGKISITTLEKDGVASISIRDEGQGIAQKDIPHIFDRFYRTDSARSKHSTNGYGLGLSIAKKIVETHNGSIHVVSKIGSGSTFTVKLPKQFS
jgi:two-component system, OmpR family, sensor histidine kinase CiaH